MKLTGFPRTLGSRSWPTDDFNKLSNHFSYIFVFPFADIAQTEKAQCRQCEGASLWRVFYAVFIIYREVLNVGEDLCMGSSSKHMINFSTINKGFCVSTKELNFKGMLRALNIIACAIILASASSEI